ncbi:hypothetical protein POM88_039348 [Heracleum sosnowskyi]|uniref:RNase H type-1 domain-containing protein n=1 Tax=Heracleum sosnowskyi TaxID=360622 RepID=A0AAD8H9U9_9APIA|nr:hypothetical protein POM88_039348 [Heracleum sosnowskyi]
MATSMFNSVGLDFVPNNYAAPLSNANTPEAFHLLQNFLAQSEIGRALVEPAKLYGSQIKALWETGVYDNGGDSGTPSIVFEFQETEYVITPGTVREAMGFAEYDAYTIAVGDTNIQRMMQAIGYSGSLVKIGEKLTENRHVVYFSRFCQILFSACVPNVEIDEEDEIPSFKLHKRVFSDLTNKDLKKVNVGELLLPERVHQFLNPQPQPQQQPQQINNDTQVAPRPKTGGRTKHRAFKAAKTLNTDEVGGSTSVETSRKKRKVRANRLKSVAVDAVEASETETDEETLHQRKRRIVAAQLFGAENIEDEIPVYEAVFEDRVSMEHETPEVQEEVFDTAVPTEDRVNAETEAPTSNADDVVEEAAVFSDSRVFENEDINMEAHPSISFCDTEDVATDQATLVIADSVGSHTEVLSVNNANSDKGAEVDQSLEEDAVLLETLQQSVVEVVTREAEVSAQANSDIPETVAEKVLDETAQLNNEVTAENAPATNEADINEEDEHDAEGSHSHPSIQVSLSAGVNSEEEREVNRATSEYYQDMYFSNWSSKDTIFSNERAADFVTKSSKEIQNPELLSHLKATIVQIKSLNNHFDDSDKVITGLRNDIAQRELTQQKDKSLYISLCKDQKNFDSRLSKVEENQVKMSTKLDEIANSIELLTSVLLSDDVKKGESVPSNKCKDTQTLRRRDDSNDGGSKGGEKSLRLNSDRSFDRRPPRPRSNSDRRSNSGKGNVNSASGSKLKSLINTDKPSTDEEIAAKVFMAEHGKDVTIEDIQAEEQMLAEEHKKNLEAGIYKKKEIKAPRKKETGITIKENTQQSIQSIRRPVIPKADKGKGILVEEEQLPKKFKSTSDIAQVETRLAKSTSDAAQVDVTTKVMTTSDVAQVVQKSTQLPGFSKPKILEDLKLEAVNFSETRTVFGKEAYDKSGLGSHRERRTNNRSQDNISLAESGIGVTQENLDKLESVQLIFHRVLKKQFLLYFMSDGRVYKVEESDVNLKSWEELEYVLYLLKVKNRHTHDVAQVLRDKMLRSKAMLGGGVSSVYIPKYRDAYGKLVEMKRNSARFKTALGVKVLEFNLESDKAHYIRLGNDMKKNSIYSLRAAIYQTGEGDPEYKELKEIMIAELENAERRLLIDYLRTVPDVQEVKFLIEYALKLDFPTTNNEAEYEALIVGLGLDGVLRVKTLKVCGDSRLVVSQVNGEFEARDEVMAKYLKLVKAIMTQFDECYVEHIHREEKMKADALSKFASSEIENYAGSVYFQVLKTPSINGKLIAPIDVASCWMDLIKSHLETGCLPNDTSEARKLYVRALRYTLIEGILYKKSFVVPYLKCLRPQEAVLALREVYYGICGQHLGGKAIAHKITRLGFYWPNVLADAKNYVKRCE